VSDLTPVKTGFRIPHEYRPVGEGGTK
jgi:hypothetical protein